MKKRCFISLEGGEGAGKTTIAARLKDELEKKGKRALVTREPGGIEIAEQIRAVILHPGNRSMDGRTEALLYAAARRQHLVEKVIPALEQGMIVICDRFVDSSLAYQGFARGLGMEEVFRVNQFAIGTWMPDVTIYFDLDPETGLARIRADQNREVNRLDLEQLDFHHRVREGYQRLVEKFPDRIRVVDAGQPLEQVYRDVTNILRPWIPDL